MGDEELRQRFTRVEELISRIAEDVSRHAAIIETTREDTPGE